MIDLRSDTVSKPTEAMRRAIYEADVGDNCFGDDRDTLRLEEYCADYFGKPEALFMASGTLSNQVAVRALTQPGDEVVIHRAYHINFFEAAATSAFSGVNFNLLDSEDGLYSVADLDCVYNSKARRNSNYALPKLVVVENTVGSRGGTVFPLTTIADIANWAHTRGAKVYLDGARILHASAATGIDVKQYTRHVDAIAVCMSKGLGAPIGSVLLGDAEFIAHARKYRKWFGGDLHQSGMAASGALYAMKHHVERLTEDHENVKLLYESLQDIPKIRCIYRGTNMLIVRVDELGVTADVLAEDLRSNDVLCLAWDEKTLRFMSCLDVDRQSMQRAAAIVRSILARRVDASEFCTP
ncbi:threonine aldolase family protein [Paraburkholderia bannensis]|uniref:threonine aldolase family protein n=1 Tax=Paraburkholderia bannensis TaxID=765414 RepID=UPI002AB6B1B4|nr:threonine aldolase family protein [Paraburkholderia bannensis]